MGIYKAQIFPFLHLSKSSWDSGRRLTVRFIVNFVAEMPLPPPGFVVTAGGPSGAAMARCSAAGISWHQGMEDMGIPKRAKLVDNI
jgi:hypothetical protein